MLKKKKGPAGGVSVDQIEKLGKNSVKRKVAISAVTMTLFFAILIFFAIMTVFGDKASFSELENRYLSDPPKVSAKNIYGGDFSADTETYVADHFFGRNVFVKFKTYADLLVGKTERNGVYIIKGSRLAQRVNEPDSELINKSINAVNTFAADNPDVPVFFMLAPTSGDIYSDELPKNAPMLDEKTFIENVYGGLSSDISTIDAYSVMSLNKDSYIYYRNDHHWTSYGAYLAYTAAAKKMGFTAAPLSSFDIEHASDDFKGTLYSSALYDGIEADTIDFYHPINGCNVSGEYVYKSFGEEPEFYDDIYFREYLDVKDKYSAFTGSNQPLIKITSDSTGGKLLIIKDSYAHSFVPFLTQNYSEVTMLDMRYIQISYKELIDVSEYDGVLFLYNAATFSTDDNLKKLTY
ncbi:MAG: DHHW family protein [Oscillospiraceae bacterium]|nr:DHHW family protein [Oscillospiraceae bacterium]